MAVMDTAATAEYVERTMGSAREVADAILRWGVVVEEATKRVVASAQYEGYDLDRTKVFSVLVGLLDRAMWHAATHDQGERADALAVVLGMHPDCDNRGGACAACRQGGAR